MADDEHKFPVLWQVSRKDRRRLEELGCPRYVPWSFVAPHEPQALRNHDQTLERLAQRGGLSPSELVAVITGRSLRAVMKTSDVDAVPELLLLLAAQTREPTHVEILSGTLKCECGRDTELTETVYGGTLPGPLVAHPRQVCDGCGRTWWCPSTVDCIDDDDESGTHDHPLRSDAMETLEESILELARREDDPLSLALFLTSLASRVSAIAGASPAKDGGE